MTLKLCLLFQHAVFYFDDNTFFTHLINQSYDIWSDLYSLIHALPNKHLIYLHSPHDYVPSKYTHAHCPTFFKQWLQINENKTIINGDETCFTDIEYYDKQGSNEQLKQLSVLP